jgi:hypothetical protein
MKRLAVLVAVFGLYASPVFATADFNKEWKSHFLPEDANADFKSAAGKAGCNVCHVNKAKKTERNEYGKAVSEFLKKEKFTKEWIKENPEEAKKLIIEGLEKAGEKKSSDGKTFGEKIKEGTLPATDSGL